MKNRKSWKQNPVVIPRFLFTAVKRGLRLADTIGIEAGDDKTWLTITFRKLPAATSPDRTEPSPAREQP